MRNNRERDKISEAISHFQFNRQFQEGERLNFYDLAIMALNDLHDRVSELSPIPLIKLTKYDCKPVWMVCKDWEGYVICNTPKTGTDFYFVSYNNTIRKSAKDYLSTDPDTHWATYDRDFTQ